MPGTLRSGGIHCKARIHSPRTWGAPHNPGTPLFPFPRGWALRWGSTGGTESWRGFLGLLLVSSASPSSLLTPPTLTPKLPRAGPKSHRPPASFPGWTGVFFPGESRLSRETPVAVRMGGGSLCIPELGETPKLSQSRSSALLLPGRSVRNSEGTNLEQGVLREI